MQGGAGQIAQLLAKELGGDTMIRRSAPVRRIDYSDPGKIVEANTGPGFSACAVRGCPSTDWFILVICMTVYRDSTFRLSTSCGVIFADGLCFSSSDIGLNLSIRNIFPVFFQTFITQLKLLLLTYLFLLKIWQCLLLSMLY